jgi:hypothetical protein
MAVKASVPTESERKLCVFVLTHFLHAKPRSGPLRSKMLYSGDAVANDISR